MPREVFIAGQILTAAEMNSVSDQTVMVFAGTAARGSAIPTPTEGMVTYLSDSNLVEAYTGAEFKPVSSILQVVSTTKTDTFTTTSATFVDVTGLTAAITPSSASSKILVIAQVTFSLVSGGTGYGHFRIAGGNTDSYLGTGSGSRVPTVFGGSNATGINNENITLGASIVYLDSPATTSPVTYSVRARQAFAGTVFVNRSSSDPNDATGARGASSITVMEVAG